MDLQNEFRLMEDEDVPAIMAKAEYLVRNCEGVDNYNKAVLMTIDGNRAIDNFKNELRLLLERTPLVDDVIITAIDSVVDKFFEEEIDNVMKEVMSMKNARTESIEYIAQSNALRLKDNVYFNDIGETIYNIGSFCWVGRHTWEEPSS